MHLAEMEAAKAGMPVVRVNHDSIGGPTVKDIHLENFNISVGGRDLIVDGSITLSYGRHYGEFGFLFLHHAIWLHTNNFNKAKKEKKGYPCSIYLNMVLSESICITCILLFISRMRPNLPQWKMFWFEYFFKEHINLCFAQFNKNNLEFYLLLSNISG